MRQVKIRGGWVFRRGFKCRGEDLESLYLDHVMSINGDHKYELGTEDVRRLVSWLRRWGTRTAPIHDTLKRIRAHAHAVVRETENLE
jgi:hypothetical protein